MKSLQSLYFRVDGKGDWTHSDTAIISKLTVDFFTEMFFKDGGIQVSFVFTKKE